MSHSTALKSRPSHDFVFDVLRGLAALAVFLSHSDHAHLFYYPVLVAHKDWLGRFGVDLFFILSGFLIWGSAKSGLGQPGGLLRYAINRLTRLAPLYWLSLAAAIYFIPLLGSDFHPAVSGASIGRHLMFTQSFAPSVARDLNPVLWTISHEVTFYLLVPLLMAGSRLLRIEWMLAASVLFLLPGVSEWFGAVAPFLQLFYLFAFGIGFREFGARLGRATALLLTGLALVAPRAGLDPGLSVALAAMAVFVAANACSTFIRSERSWFAPVFDGLRRLGVISYSLYIWHYLLLNVLSHYGPGLRHVLALFGAGALWDDLNVKALVTAASMVGVSYASYVLVERPGMTWVRDGLLQWAQLLGHRLREFAAWVRRLDRAVLVLAIAYGAAFLIWYVAEVPRVLHNDWLVHLQQYVHWDHTGDYAAWLSFVFEFQVGHIVAVQKVFAAINYFLLGQRFTVSVVVGCLVMAAYWAWPCWLWTAGRVTPAAALGCLVFALLVFSPHLANIYDWPDSILAHYPLAMFALLATRNADRAATANGWHREAVFWTVSAVLLACLTSGSGFAVLPSVLVTVVMRLWLAGRLRHLLSTQAARGWVVVMALGVAAVAYWALSHANTGLSAEKLLGPRLVLSRPVDFLMHFFATVASPWCHFSIERSVPGGLLAMAGFGIVVVKSLRERRSEAVPWIGLGVFGLLSCLIVSITRFDHDFEGGTVATRYAIYAMPIYEAMIALVVLRLRDVATFHGLLPRHKRMGFAAAIVAAMITFVASSVAMYGKEVHDNAELLQYARGLLDWNGEATHRMLGKNVAQLYLETLPLLKAAGKARVLTDDFVLSGSTTPAMEAALAAYRKGQAADATRYTSCDDAPIGAVHFLGWDDTYAPRKRVLGVGFIRAIGYVRDPYDCDKSIDTLIMIDGRGQPLCNSRSTRDHFYYLPDRFAKSAKMGTPLMFDFSCPAAHEGDAMYPVRVLAYNSSNGMLYLVGAAASPEALGRLP